MMLYLRKEVPQRLKAEVYMGYTADLSPSASQKQA
jgi:hypothetical protein